MVAEASAARPAASKHALFDLAGVSFRVPGRSIIESLDLRMEAGQIHGLIGPNGSGKSTLVKMLARQEVPASGRIHFCGEDIQSQGDRVFARRLAYLPQFMPSTDGMNVEEFVALGRFPWHGTFGRFTVVDRAKVAEAMDQTGVTPFRARLVDTLSGGERQRVWLALLLAQDTQCLVLDEPTSALDISHQTEMLDLVRNLARKRGLSVVVVLHDINMAARICDRLVAMGSGRIVADGTPADIMRADVLERIYGISMGLFTHPDSGIPVAFVR
ncbi:ATP-binding cassette domain-containing protein [Tianweitania sp. BSSL-BM11]|uniref:ATP-binding cassette domain-containing protein n=1 Tax=Tianweitania aestuarii TaxID=2814886 RepID=A0ABS5S0N7_9HYPH|nr:ATP-binding cassette domain-containing protein [Tianweitania aestuarii]MBS9722101.1 ATP-binding cassette domain-containing protein [Tianweitania aestuarii]